MLFYSCNSSFTVVNATFRVIKASFRVIKATLKAVNASLTLKHAPFTVVNDSFTVADATFTVVNAWFYNCIILIFLQVWSGGPLRANYNLHHVDPTVQSIAFKLTVIQVKPFFIIFLFISCY